MKSTLRSLTFSALAAFVLTAQPALAQSGKSEKPAKSTQGEDLENYTCKDVMRMSGDDRVIALSVLHGYTLGKKGTTKYVPAELSKVSDSFVEYCLSNPNDKALGAFAKLAK